MRNSTIGIFGEGALGQGTAKIAKGFGMEVLFADHPPPKADGVEFTDAEEVLKDQILSLCTVLSRTPLEDSLEWSNLKL